MAERVSVNFLELNRFINGLRLMPSRIPMMVPTSKQNVGPRLSHERRWVRLWVRSQILPAAELDSKPQGPFKAEGAAAKLHAIGR
jgi:hypothetical protein